MLIATLLEPVAEKPQPLIDIDWTVLIQFGIFVVMLVVLWTLVFRPYLRVQDERGRRIDGARAEAKSMQERAAAMVADHEAQLVRARQRGAEERLRLRAEGQAHERAVLARAREIGQQALEAARQQAGVQRAAASTQLLAESQVIGRRIAARVLGREL